MTSLLCFEVFFLLFLSVECITIQRGDVRTRRHDGTTFYQIPNPDNYLHIYSLPVGQGDATIIQCPNPGGEIYIFDMGSSRISMTREHMVNFLFPQRDKIKGIIASHADIDHYNYMYQVLTYRKRTGNSGGSFGYTILNTQWNAYYDNGKNTDAFLLYTGNLNNYDSDFSTLAGLFDNSHTYNINEPCFIGYSSNNEYKPKRMINCGMCFNSSKKAYFFFVFMCFTMNVFLEFMQLFCVVLYHIFNVVCFHVCPRYIAPITPVFNCLNTRFEILTANFAGLWVDTDDCNAQSTAFENYKNTLSIILKITDKITNHSIILPADFERTKEWSILDEFDKLDKFKSTIFKLSHHGSRHSIPSYSYNMIQPQYVLISGNHEQFKHPNCDSITQVQSWLNLTPRRNTFVTDMCYDSNGVKTELIHNYFYKNTIDFNGTCWIINIRFDNDLSITENKIECNLYEFHSCIHGGFNNMLPATQDPAHIRCRDLPQNWNLNTLIITCQNYANENRYCCAVIINTQTNRLTRCLCNNGKQAYLYPNSDSATNYVTYVRNRYTHKKRKRTNRRILTENNGPNVTNSSNDCLSCIFQPACPALFNLPKLHSITLSNGSSTEACILFAACSNDTCNEDLTDLFFETFNDINYRIELKFVFKNLNETYLVGSDNSTNVDNIFIFERIVDIFPNDNFEDSIYDNYYYINDSRNTISFIGECNCYEIIKSSFYNITDEFILSKHNNFTSAYNCSLLCDNNNECDSFMYLIYYQECTLLTFNSNVTTSIHDLETPGIPAEKLIPNDFAVINSCTKSPTLSPTLGPTLPTDAPTDSPTNSPTSNPTKSPTKKPTSNPTKKPTRRPTDSESGDSGDDNDDDDGGCGGGGLFGSLSCAIGGAVSAVAGIVDIDLDQDYSTPSPVAQPAVFELGTNGLENLFQLATGISSSNTITESALNSIAKCAINGYFLGNYYCNYDSINEVLMIDVNYHDSNIINNQNNLVNKPLVSACLSSCSNEFNNCLNDQYCMNSVNNYATFQVISIDYYSFCFGKCNSTYYITMDCLYINCFDYNNIRQYFATPSPISSPTDSPTESPTNTPTNSPTIHPTSDPTRNPTICRLKHVGSLEFAYSYNCDTHTDDQIDSAMDNICNSSFPGSRNIRGSDLINGNYKNILHLPENPIQSFRPSCPYCGDGCDSSNNARYCVLVNTETWNITEWGQCSGSILSVECVINTCFFSLYPTKLPTTTPTYDPTKIPSINPTVNPIPDCEYPLMHRLKYMGNVQFIKGGFRCDTWTDDEVDARLDDQCNKNYPGSKNIRGIDIINYKYLNIIDLPERPIGFWVPSCPVCGSGCGNGTRLYTHGSGAEVTWDLNVVEFWTEFPGNILSAECAIDVCVNQTSNPTLTPSNPTNNPTDNPTMCRLMHVGTLPTAHTYKCSTHTDSQIDALMDNLCNSSFPGSRNIRGTEIDNGNYQNIIFLPDAPSWSFLPSCPTCGGGCDNEGRRYCALGTPNSWDLTTFGHCTGSILSTECVINTCFFSEYPTKYPTMTPTYEPSKQPSINPTVSPYKPCQFPEFELLEYVGYVSYIKNGFRCDTWTDAEVDARLNDQCNKNYPGSRNIRGIDIVNYNYVNIRNLPERPQPFWVPSCPVCGAGCANGTRLYANGNGAQVTWDLNQEQWWTEFPGNVLTAECIISYCEVATDEPTKKPVSLLGGPNNVRNPTHQPIVIIKSSKKFHIKTTLRSKLSHHELNTTYKEDVKLLYITTLELLTTYIYPIDFRVIIEVIHAQKRRLFRRYMLQNNNNTKLNNITIIAQIITESNSVKEGLLEQSKTEDFEVFIESGLQNITGDNILTLLENELETFGDGSKDNNNKILTVIIILSAFGVVVIVIILYQLRRIYRNKSVQTQKNIEYETKSNLELQNVNIENETNEEGNIISNDKNNNTLEQEIVDAKITNQVSTKL